MEENATENLNKDENSNNVEDQTKENLSKECFRQFKEWESVYSSWSDEDNPVINYNWSIHIDKKLTRPNIHNNPSYLRKKYPPIYRMWQGGILIYDEDAEITGQPNPNPQFKK